MYGHLYFIGNTSPKNSRGRKEGLTIAGPGFMFSCSGCLYTYTHICLYIKNFTQKKMFIYENRACRLKYPKVPQGVK